MFSRYFFIFTRSVRSKLGFFSENRYRLLSENIVDLSKPNLLSKIGYQFSFFCGLSSFLFYALYLWTGNVLLIGFSIYSVIFTLYCFQDFLLYQPNEPDVSRLIVENPGRFSLPFETISIPTVDNENLHGYLIKQRERSDQCETLLFFHGNAGNIGHRLQNAQLLYHTCHINILLFDYRGYGKSTGTPSEKGLYIDAQAVFDYVRTRSDLNQEKIFLFGRSLGGAVAIQLASCLNQLEVTPPLHCVLLENTFTSIPDMAKHLFPTFIIDYVPKFFYKNLFFSSLKIRHINVPVLFIAAGQDEIVPHEMMLELHQECQSPSKVLEVFPDGQHNTTWLCRNYSDKVRSFLNRIDSNRNSTSENRISSPYLV